MYKLLLSFTVISDVYRSFIPHKTTFIKHGLIPQSFEIFWVTWSISQVWRASKMQLFMRLSRFSQLTGMANRPDF